MKIPCKLSIYNRTCQTYIQAGKNRHVSSTLAICSKPKTDEHCILMFNSNNKHGTKYTLKGNIYAVLTRFINEGKATLKFQQPPHDLLIQADKIQLKSFLHLLKNILENKLTNKQQVCSTMSVTPVAAKDLAPKKLIIKSRSEYPSKGFPRTLEVLFINDVKRCSLDQGILFLVKLSILNVSNNCIEYLPEELNKLPSLRELNVSFNHLYKSGLNQWKWMGGNLSKTLISLNISSNNLKYIPIEILKLHKLEYLNINNNEIAALPSGIGNLRLLKTFDCSKNQISVVPGSMKNCKLQHLDISENHFASQVQPESLNVKLPKNRLVWSLKEYAARKVLLCRLLYSAETLPVTLVNFLDGAKYCVCGKACFSDYIRQHFLFLLSSIAQELIVTPGLSGFVPMDCYFCSIDCYMDYKRRHRVRILR